MRRSPARSRSTRRNPIRAAKRTPCVRRSYWGRGGAGMMFVCSEDRTVLLLLRAEWVEQGGTWGVPGGGIGEGFFSTPMEPIDDPEVFLRKAVQEVEEECGSLPPGFSEAQILGTTQYEDCGFRYRTFIVDVTVKQKAAWRLVSEDDETDAFVWFPWGDVLSGQPLDDADQHFGVVFTMKNLPAPVSARFGRANPMRFDLRYTPEEADRYRDSRAVRSILSPVLRQKNITRMANTPHNFVVVVQEDGEGSALPLFEDAVTLSLSLRGVHNNDFDYAADEDKRVRESLYTAFTLLHRLGDVLYEDMIFGGSLYAPEKRPANPVYAEFYKMADAHLEILEEAGWAPSRQKAYAIYTRLLGESVNSKMVREGYSGQWDQAFADLFPLCELTPPSRPLLLPLSAQADSRLAERTFNEQIVPDFNVRFRAFYNRLIPSLYGTAKRI